MENVINLEDLKRCLNSHPYRSLRYCLPDLVEAAIEGVLKRTREMGIRIPRGESILAASDFGIAPILGEEYEEVNLLAAIVALERMKRGEFYISEVGINMVVLRSDDGDKITVSTRGFDYH